MSITLKLCMTMVNMVGDFFGRLHLPPESIPNNSRRSRVLFRGRHHRCCLVGLSKRDLRHPIAIGVMGLKRALGDVDITKRSKHAVLARQFVCVLVLVQCCNHCSGNGLDREAAVLVGLLPFEPFGHNGKRRLWRRRWCAVMPLGARMLAVLGVRGC